MKLFVDTSVWSLALRRDAPEPSPHVAFLATSLRSGDLVFTTGLVLQELLQGFAGPRDRDAILSRFAPLPFLVPERSDHVEAARIRNECRRGGVQMGTIDALLGALCLRHGLLLLSTDGDFLRMASIHPLSVWQPQR
jgi:predicted nucleic acid-binding protein